MRPPRHFIVAAVVVAASGFGVSGFALAADVTVTLTPTGPQPPRLTVALGDSITFVNNTPDARVLRARNEGFGETTIPAGGQHKYVATRPGIISYRFGDGRTDRGAVTVQRVGSVTLASKARSVTFGETLRLTGTAAPSGFPVTIEERGRSGSGWKQVATATPAPEGAFALKVKPLLATQYVATLFEGVLRSDRVTVRVKPNIRLSSTARRSRTGNTVKLRARVAPTDAASRITLSSYNRERKAWRRVSTQRLTNGRAVIPWKVDEGVSRLRLSIDQRYAKPGLESGVSNVIVFTGIGKATEAPRQRS